MDHNMSLVTKKMWNIVRAALFMLKKGISKSKIMLELNMMMKRGKIVGKTMIGNIMFHHHNYHSDHTDVQHEFEFSCSNSPANYFPFHDGHDLASLNVVNTMQEKLNKASPMMSGSRKGALVRQVRVTDSPFPFQDAKENDSKVDAAAEEFIQKFYRQLKRQMKSP